MLLFKQKYNNNNNNLYCLIIQLKKYKLYQFLIDHTNTHNLNRKRDDELGIRQQELKLEHRHAQLKDQLNTRLSCSSEYHI